MGKQPTQQQEEGARQGQYKAGFVSPLIQTWQMGLIFVLILWFRSSFLKLCIENEVISEMEGKSAID